MVPCPTLHRPSPFLPLAPSGAADCRRDVFAEATFRVADERGWEPTEECIDGEGKLGHKLSTALPVSNLCAKLRKKGFVVDVSKDPGRFVCNWIYFCSLKSCRDKM